VHYTNGADIMEIQYHALVFASGGRTPSPMYTPYPSTGATRSAMSTFRAALPKARSIVIGGGGAAGVETAAEIAEYLNGARSWLPWSTWEPKVVVTIVTRASKLLPTLSEAAARHAERYLERLGVQVLYGRSIVRTIPEDAGESLSSLAAGDGDGTFQVFLDDRQTLEADIYVPCFHGKPTTQYVPAALLTPSGHVRIDEKTLRVVGAGPLVYALGEVSSNFKGGSLAITNMTKILTGNLKRDLQAANGMPLEGKDHRYEHDPRATQFVPVGRTKGVGQFMGCWLPSWVVWMLKGRTYMTDITSWYLYGGLVRWPKP
jgi:apoptosis-inducing factor 2